MPEAATARSLARLLHRLREKRARLRNWMLRKNLLTIAPLDIHHVWLRSPSIIRSERICVLVCFSVSGMPSEHTLFLARNWRLQGFKVILVIATNRPADVSIAKDAYPELEGIMIRNNSGYDFGSWATAIRACPGLLDCSLLVLANDSLYGPLARFDELIARVDRSSADLVGVIDSYEYQHHIQSFLVFYKPRALQNPAFLAFWNNVRGGMREETIQCSELPQLKIMQTAGITTEVLFPLTPGLITNPTLFHWRQLVDQGFPFVKVQLLRENPWGADIRGWDRLMRERDYDPGIVFRHLGTAFPDSAAAAACESRLSIEIERKVDVQS